MKLLQITSKTYLLFSAILISLAGCLLYFLMVSTIEEEITEKLLANKERIVKKIEQGGHIVELSPIIEVRKLNKDQQPSLVIRDTAMFDPIEEEQELFKEVTSIEDINGSLWSITIRQVILEPHDYFSSIGLTLAIVMAFLLLGLLIINRFISHKLWQPFYRGLKALREFSVEDDKKLMLQPTNIIEFNELNEAIAALTEKINSDYRTLKEFTENASHEIQTPLSIIQSKLDTLFQSNLTDSQAKEFHTVYTATQRLSKLNKTLLLLTKIENHQYPEKEDIRISDFIDRLLNNFDDFTASKHLSLEKDIQAELMVNANPLLLETLIANILNNAIKYNIEGGTIKISNNGNTLTISNTGKPLTSNPEEMFRRFSKGETASPSLGLGLAIVKKICDINNWVVSYSTRDNWHTLQIKF